MADGILDEALERLRGTGPERTGWLSNPAPMAAEAWPRLLPGSAAGATHGVIRVGHAVRSLLDLETGPRVTELAHGLAYWAARWQPLALPAAGPYRASVSLVSLVV